MNGGCGKTDHFCPFLSISVQIEMMKMDKEKPRVLDEKTGFIRSGTDETRTRDLRLDRPAF